MQPAADDKLKMTGRGLQLSQIRGRIKQKKELRQPFDCLVELGFDVCLQQNDYTRVGVGLGERRQRATEEIAGNAKIW